MSHDHPIRTLLVESRPDVRAALADVLARCDCDVTAVERDGEACDRHLADPFPLAVIGVDPLPDQGFWLCRRLRSISDGSHPILLALSDSWTAGRMAWLLEAGVDDCLTASSDETPLVTFLALVRRRLGLCSWERETASDRGDSSESRNPPVEPLPHGAFRSSLRQRRFLQVNRALVDMLGYESEQELLAVDMTTSVYQTPLDPNAFIALYGDHLTGIELLWKRKDGAPLIVRISGRAIRDACNVPQQFEGIVEDVTNRKLIEQSLRESERMLRGLVENLPDVIVVVAADWTIQFINRDPRDRSCKETIGVSVFSLVPPEYKQPFLDARRRLLQSNEPQTIEICDIFGDWWTVRIISFEPGGSDPGMLFIGTNVTERKTAAQAIEKEQESLRRMLELFERDRELIAFEIHDGFSQQLTGALLNFEADRQLRETSGRPVGDSFDLGLRLLRESIAEARRLVRGLRPPVLDAFGIVPAVEHLIEDHHATGGGQVEFSTSGLSGRLAHPLESAIFRTVQEALTNARKHSRSDHIRIQLLQEAGRLCVEIHDWGVGFDPDKVGDDHFGLRGIRERARLLGGAVQIDARPGHGARLRVELPAVARAAPPNGE
ncbi:MAG TPA: PAS domain S-box protein [Thermoguttaceae bacterium]|nr:PAS domain S-box protein [Thermoguttaceae bacterium]